MELTEIVKTGLSFGTKVVIAGSALTFAFGLGAFGGYLQGRNDGFSSGKELGEHYGQRAGLKDGKDQGYSLGLKEGTDLGYKKGIQDITTTIYFLYPEIADKIQKDFGSEFLDKNQDFNDSLKKYLEKHKDDGILKF